MEGSTRKHWMPAWGAEVALLIAYCIAMSLLGLSAYVDQRSSSQQDAGARAVSRTLEALEKIRQTSNVLFVAESSQRGYVLTGQPTYLATYRDMQQRMPRRLDELGQVLSDTPAQQAALKRLRTLADDQFAAMERPLAAFAADGQAQAIASVASDAGVNSLSAARDVIRSLLDEESRLLGERRTEAASAYSRGMLRGFLSSGVVALALTLFYFMIRRTLRERNAANRALEASNADLEAKVSARTSDLSHLSRHLLNLREHEKKSIARDLHDEFGSYLTAINMDVSRARDKIAASNPEQASKLDRTLGLLGSAIEMKRRLISNLRPSMLDNLGLGAALEQYVDEWSRFTGISVVFDHAGELQSDDDGCPIAIYRVFQEALNNVARHSGATEVVAHVRRVDDHIEFEIADNGVGLPDANVVKPGAHGLLGIRERVLAYHGHLEITAAPRGGTVLRATLPCKLGEESSADLMSALA